MTQTIIIPAVAAIGLAASVLPHAQASRYLSLAPRRLSPSFPLMRQRNNFDLMSDIFSVPIYYDSLMRQFDNEFARVQKLAPRYDIKESDDGFELEMELPGVKSSDLTVKIEEGGRILHVSGTRKYKEGKEGQVVSSTSFDQKFTVDNRIMDIDQMTATLSDGVLLVSAPRRESTLEDVKVLPIMEKKENLDSIVATEVTEVEEEKMEPKDDGDLVITEDE